jgi:uncharacterized protein YecE (DUF72 family)
VAKLYVGISGYAYKEWQGEGLFYPPGLKEREFLGYYASRYGAVEFLGATLKPPADSSVAKWLAETPEGFQVSPKMQEQVTHRARLKPESLPVLNTFVEKLEPVERAGRLGPILLQLPPNFKRHDELLGAFLSALPKRPTLRWAVEFRNPSWNDPEVERILRDVDVAWVAAETDDAPAQRRDCAGHLYARLRRLEYTDAQLQDWADYLQTKLAEGRDCYVYCRHKDVPAPWKWADRLLNRTGA